MNKIISVASGFQYSVNIGYDLNQDDKLQNFIPTKSSLELMQDILLSTQDSSTERARVLVGAYGKGKSHIILTILSILMRKDWDLFDCVELPVANHWDGHTEKDVTRLLSLDVRSVVSCCDCKHFQVNVSQSGYLPQGVPEWECRYWCRPTDPTDFCSYGEKREES